MPAAAVMTVTVQLQKRPGVSRARERSVCGAPGCYAGISPGAPIVRHGRFWKHEDCDRPGKWRRDRPGGHGKVRLGSAMTAAGDRAWLPRTGRL